MVLKLDGKSGFEVNSYSFGLVLRRRLNCVLLNNFEMFQVFLAADIEGWVDNIDHLYLIKKLDTAYV